MRLVEFIGPPGCGKTTTFRRARAIRRGRSFLTFEDAGLAEVSPEVDAPLLDIAKAAVLESSESEDVIGRRIGGVAVELSRARRVAAIPGNDIVLTDECLGNWGLSLALCAGARRDLVRQYFQEMPQPYAVVLYEVSRTTAYRRNKRRGARGRTDRSRDWEVAMKTARDAAAILERRGSKVFKLNGARKVRETAYWVTRFVDDLRTGQA